MSARVDLNCDMGESFGAYRIGADDAVFPFITSANIACGYHGGDPAVMRTTLERAKTRGRRSRRASGLSGSHRLRPAQHGRRRRRRSTISSSIRSARCSGFARAAKMELQHVKAHGALYNMAAAKPDLAAAIARAVRDVDRSLVLFGLPGSHLISEGEAAGLEDGGRSVRRSQLHERRLARLAQTSRRAGPRRRRGGAPCDSHGARRRGDAGGRRRHPHQGRHDLHPRRRSARRRVRAATSQLRSKQAGIAVEPIGRAARCTRSELPSRPRPTCRSPRRSCGARPDRSAVRSRFRRARRRESAPARRDTTE